MKPGDWERVDQLFQRAIELPPDERRAFVRRESMHDAELQREVLSLLSFDNRTDGGLGTAVRSVAAWMVEETEIVGERIGIYRILRKIGEGGMGSVYQGVRDDGEFSKEVAIKIVRLGMETPQFVERFRRERQILANLDHPHVARLYDGGAALLPGRTMAVPYLVMEFVNGVPIHTYCRQHDLGTAELCRLFVKVCEAVAYAHSQLIVHRDIKPGNILVAADGSPKLLDFGIAQLIEQPEPLDPKTNRRPLTLDYASPEQVRGESAGIGADVYSLGAVFYELLTDVRPHRFRSYSAPEVERVICEDDLVLPSRTGSPRASDLRGDLDAVVMKAMRKEAVRRYSNVDELRRDIEAYLRDVPVEARAGGAGYRAGKFARRHRWAVAGGVVAVLSLAAGTAGALSQAERAVKAQQRAEAATREAVVAHDTELVHRQRAEQSAALAEARQRTADTQRAEAERRLRQVRELANRLLFEYQNEVAALPGSTTVRKKMVETGLAYFDSLAKDPGVGPDVRREMVDGWRRLGDIQGNPYVSNLGNVGQALASYDRALAMTESSNAAVRVQLLVGRGDVLAATGDFVAGEAEYGKALRIVDAGKPPDASLRPLILEHYGDLQERRGQLTASLALYQRAIAVSRETSLAIIYHKAGALLTRLGRAPEARDYFQKSLALCDAAATGNNLDPRVLRIRLWVYTGLSDLYRSYRSVLNGKVGDSSVYIERALEFQDRLRAVEPFNQQYARDWTLLEQRATSTNLTEGRYDDAIRHGFRAVDAAEALARLAPGQSQTDVLLATALIRLAKPLTYKARFREAESAYIRADEALHTAAKRNANEGVVLRERYYLARDRYELQAEMATSPQRLVELRTAVAPLREAIRLNEELLRREPNSAFIRSDRGDLLAVLAVLLADTGSPDEACVAYAEAYRSRSLDKRPLRPSGIEAFKALDAKLPNCKKD